MKALKEESEAFLGLGIQASIAYCAIDRGSDRQFIGVLIVKGLSITQAVEALEEEREALLGQGIQLDAKFAATRSASAALAAARATAEERARDAAMQLEEALSELIPARAELAAMAKRIQVSTNPPWSDTPPLIAGGGPSELVQARAELATMAKRIQVRKNDVCKRK